MTRIASCVNVPFRFVVFLLDLNKPIRHIAVLLSTFLSTSLNQKWLNILALAFSLVAIRFLTDVRDTILAADVRRLILK